MAVWQQLCIFSLRAIISNANPVENSSVGKYSELKKIAELFEELSKAFVHGEVLNIHSFDFIA